MKNMMKILPVIPGEGIGALKLGMSPAQIREAVSQELSSLHIADASVLDISTDREAEGYTLRYQKGALFFMVRYIHDRAAEISVDRSTGDAMHVVLLGADVFKTRFDDLLHHLKHFSQCCFDSEDELLGTDYDFCDIGIRLWREEPFHEKLLADKAYMETMHAVIEEMYRCLYFDMITLRSL
ncbi:MAG: hypothetical protein IJB22_06855 [Clostridia bacterium]|nr:hypothetical protein [Clostridia bacterium]